MRRVCSNAPRSRTVPVFWVAGTTRVQVGYGGGSGGLFGFLGGILKSFFGLVFGSGDGSDIPPSGIPFSPTLGSSEPPVPPTESEAEPFRRDMTEYERLLGDSERRLSNLLQSKVDTYIKENGSLAMKLGAKVSHLDSKLDKVSGKIIGKIDSKIPEGLKRLISVGKRGWDIKENGFPWGKTTLLSVLSFGALQLWKRKKGASEVASPTIPNVATQEMPPESNPPVTTAQVLTRNYDEAEQLLELARLEGRGTPVDVMRGVMFDDELEQMIQKKGKDAELANKLKRKIDKKLSEIAPLK